MPKINQEEYEILKALDDKWKWIARDEDSKKSTFPNELWLYEYKPRRTQIHWLGEGGSTLRLGYVNLFQFIQWEDEEPYNIAELIEEYEKDYKSSWEHAIEFSGEVFGESEETEVKKDLNWFKEQLDDIEMNTPRLWSHDSIWMLDRVNELLNQLDEPEVLSQEWIGKNEFLVNDESGVDYTVVESRKLKGVLVPKQEELETKIKTLIEEYEKEEEAYSNPENGWISGFIGELESLLEKEQKYLVEDKNYTLLCKWKSKDGWKVISTHESEQDDLPVEVLDFELTEQEIKDYDDRYWPFRKPVEELEE